MIYRTNLVLIDGPPNSEFFKENKLIAISWPPLSPDLNPIENLWDHMKRKIKRRSPQTLVELARCILDV